MPSRATAPFDFPRNYEISVQNGRQLTPSAVGGHHANILEQNGWSFPGPSVPKHTDMYTGKVGKQAFLCSVKQSESDTQTSEHKEKSGEREERGREGSGRALTSSSSPPY